MFTLKIPGHGIRKVASFADASAVYSAVREKLGLGASKLRQGVISDATGPVARVSYNGRVWPAVEAENETPLYDNRIAEAA